MALSTGHFTPLSALTNTQALDISVGKELREKSWDKSPGERKAPKLAVGGGGLWKTATVQPVKPRPAAVAQGLVRFCLGQNKKPLVASTACCQAQDTAKHTRAQIWGCSLRNAATSSPKHRIGLITQSLSCAKFH